MASACRRANQLLCNQVMTKNQGLILVVGILAIFALVGWEIVRAVHDVTDAPAATSKGIATQMQEMLHPTPTIYPSAQTVIVQIRSLARLETAQYTVEKVITAEIGQGVLAPLFGDRLLLVAHGQVTAGVDLSKLADGDITTGPGGKVTIILPAAEVFSSALDNQKSYVYDRQTGLLTHGDVTLESQARQAAEQEIDQVALDDGILKLAQANAATFVERLMRTLGFTDVVIVEATPVAIPQATPAQ
jgi:Protein of unknown function (DUF4230)